MLLSAIPRDDWNGAQRLSFSTVKGRTGMYLDVRSVFPTRKSQQDEEPEPLPEEPEDIVKLAAEKAKKQPVLFWGESSIYSGCSSWPKDLSFTPVGI